MINRLFGTLCAMAILAVMVCAIFNRGNYRSMLFGKSEEPAVEITEGVAPEAAEAIDTADAEFDLKEEEALSEQVVEGENNVE